MSEQQTTDTFNSILTSWKKSWVFSCAAAGVGIVIVLIAVIAYGEFDWSWVIALPLTAVFVAGMAAVIEWVRTTLERRAQERSRGL
jgi:hypothetical protein